MKTKSIFMLILIAVFAFSSISFADSSWSDSDITIGASSSNPQTVKLSNNVQAVSKFNSQTYAAATYSTAGKRVFATASGMSTIKYKWCTNQDCSAHTPTAPTLTNGDSGDLASWGSDL